VQGPNAQSSVNQGIANVDYNVSDMDRLTVKYYYQNNPTTNPFGAVGALLGFRSNFRRQPGGRYQQHRDPESEPDLAAARRIHASAAYSQTQQQFTPSDFGMNLLGATVSADLRSPTRTGSNTLEFGPSVSFGNAGMYQNQWELGSSLNWVKGRHTIAIGGSWAHTQLNIINNNTESDTLGFKSFLNFVEGAVRTGSVLGRVPQRQRQPLLPVGHRGRLCQRQLQGSQQPVTDPGTALGLRWSAFGKIRQAGDFNPSLYAYDASTDTITNSGLEVASNNAAFGTPGAGNSLLTQHQWGLAPRIGLAWTPKPKLTVRTGFGMYYDRGELFSEFSPSAGFGFNGPLGVTLEQPFVTAYSRARAPPWRRRSAPRRPRRRRKAPRRFRRCCRTSTTP
jgi:hypothetical protein